MTPSELVADGLVTVREAAAFLSLSRGSVWKLMDSGDLPFCYLRTKGNRGLAARRVPKAALVKFAADRVLGA